MQSRPLWLDLEKESGQQLLHTIGGLDFADDPDCFPELRSVAGALEQNGARYEELNAADIRKRFPQWRIPDQTIGVYSPDGGWINASKAVEAMVAQTVARGGTVRDEETVQNITPSVDSVSVQTSKGSYEAERLVIAAGAWVNTILRPFDIAVPVKITREQPVYFAPIAKAESFSPSRFPIWIHYRKPHFTYGFPLLDTPGVKLAFHHDGPVIEPSNPDRAPNPEVTRRLQEYLRTYLPEAAGRPIEEVTCLYTTTPDHNFVIDLAPGFPNVALASPCSGHGFKFATGIGRALADLVQFGQTDLEIGHTRFFTNSGR